MEFLWMLVLGIWSLFFRLLVIVHFPAEMISERFERILPQVDRLEMELVIGHGLG